MMKQISRAHTLPYLKRTKESLSICHYTQLPYLDRHQSLQVSDGDFDFMFKYKSSRDFKL